MYLDVFELDWSELDELIEESYRQMAPKRALKILDARGYGRIEESPLKP